MSAHSTLYQRIHCVLSGCRCCSWIQIISSPQAPDQVIKHVCALFVLSVRRVTILPCRFLPFLPMSVLSVTMYGSSMVSTHHCWSLPCSQSLLNIFVVNCCALFRPVKASILYENVCN
ncbi:hypothetical protein C8Q76DRAFT_723636 [Earliella scabrosa]|nr:hypothetical protein C8Q76DRAFT_723636 [Earliella scabrosa]